MINENLLKQMKDIFSADEEINKVILFGSRATNKEKENSDIDIAVVGKNDLLFCERIKEKLSILPTLLKFDVINYDDIKNAALKKHIDACGIVIYKKI